MTNLKQALQNKWRQLRAEYSPSLLVLSAVLLAVVLAGFVLFVLVVVATSLESEHFSRPICFKGSCVEDYLEQQGPAFTILTGTLDLAVSIATIGGIVVALLSYFNTSSSAALANHIEHLKVFSDYLEVEIAKRSRLKSSVIDTLLLYGVIFSQSRSGKTTVSKEFQQIIEGLNKIIIESNTQCVSGTSGGFSYRKHQEKVRKHLEPIGITVYLAPRNDYFEMEQELFSLLHRLSQSFCAPGSVPEISAVHYQ